MKTKTLTTWSALARELGTTSQTLRNWRTQDGCPKSKDLEAWLQWLANRPPERGRDTVGESATMPELKMALMLAKTRKEAALAALRQLELEREREELAPISELKATLSKLLVPMRKLLDSFPAYCAARANPENPQLAQIEIGKAMDDHVFAELQRIMKSDAAQGK